MRRDRVYARGEHRPMSPRLTVCADGGFQSLSGLSELSELSETLSDRCRTAVGPLSDCRLSELSDRCRTVISLGESWLWVLRQVRGACTGGYPGGASGRARAGRLPSRPPAGGDLSPLSPGVGTGSVG